MWENHGSKSVKAEPSNDGIRDVSRNPPPTATVKGSHLVTELRERNNVGKSWVKVRESRRRRRIR